SLDNNTIYSWQVIASDGNEGTTSSEIFQFTTLENQPPENFNLLQIPNNGTNINLNPELIWENAVDPEGDEVTYHILLDIGSVSPTTIIASDLEITNYTIENTLEYKTEYSWQVIASDASGNSTASEIFSFTTREILAVNATENAGFPERENQTLVSFNNRMWIIDGAELGDVWSSNDGVNWTEETANANFPERFDHSSVVFDNRIWVIGGTGNNVVYNDIWSSTDGINWVQENSNASFPERYDHTSVVFDNRIWVIGGQNGNSEFNDVWSSLDGVNWVQENSNAPFLSRFGHSSVVFDSRIWVIGGINSNQGSGVGNLNDVWSSVDGVNWNQETSEAGFSERYGHATVVFDNKVWILGGSGGNGLNDIWSSADGINWREESSNAAFPGRMNHRSITFDDKIWIISGWSTGSLLNDVWYLE
ncbi:MAG: kelch repeat-containing protein, partial [Candidatus Heimdallarchaeota archaeon]